MQNCKKIRIWTGKRNTTTNKKRKFCWALWANPKIASTTTTTKTKYPLSLHDVSHCLFLFGESYFSAPKQMLRLNISGVHTIEYNTYECTYSKCEADEDAITRKSVSGEYSTPRVHLCVWMCIFQYTTNRSTFVMFNIYFHVAPVDYPYRFIHKFHRIAMDYIHGLKVKRSTGCLKML